MADAAVTELAYDRFRRATAKAMVHSVTTKPQVTLHRQVDVGPLERSVTANRAGAAVPGGAGFTPALLATIARGVRGSRINGTVADQTIALYASVNLGVAVDVDGALVVPVLRDADTRSVQDLGVELRRMADVARSGKLRPEDVSGATFTVTSLGQLGVDCFTPIVNPPQMGILGVGAAKDGVRFVDGVLAATRTLVLSLSFDHAAIDGADAARVLADICRSIESPEGLPW